VGALQRTFPALSPSVAVQRKALARGFFGESRFWQVVGVLIFGRIILRRLMRTGPELVAIERLQPGQGIILTGVRNEK
jgi:hypothetical protein